MGKVCRGRLPLCTIFCHAIFWALLLVTEHKTLADSTISETVSSSESASSSLSPSSQTSSNRQKRAPGWGKRGWEEMDDAVVGNSIEDDYSVADGGTPDSVDKRAPGWGKRAPGWRKRTVSEESIPEEDDTDKRAPGWGKRAPGWGKRAPGWGKRAPGWGKRGWAGKRAPGWGKRQINFSMPTIDMCAEIEREFEEATVKTVGVDKSIGNMLKVCRGRLPVCTIFGHAIFWALLLVSVTDHKTLADSTISETVSSSESASSSLSPSSLFSSNRQKRAPGWGKRGWEEMNDAVVGNSIEDDHSVEDGETPDSVDKRAPGWGKRTMSEGSIPEQDDTDKRAPGWGKRAPGWGKRGWAGKRAPGWGKRAPGWGKRGWAGKRAPGWGKRAPGWGKRAPGWGKRTPGWGKRQINFSMPSIDNCTELENLHSE
ncbi:cerebral peptide 1, partial [Elysia marginata]